MCPHTLPLVVENLQVSFQRLDRTSEPERCVEHWGRNFRLSQLQLPCSYQLSSVDRQVRSPNDRREPESAGGH